MTKVYARILGNWFCLNDNPKCTIIPGNISPEEWADTRTPLYAPYKKIESIIGINFHPCNLFIWANTKQSLGFTFNLLAMNKVLFKLIYVVNFYFGGIFILLMSKIHI